MNEKKRVQWIDTVKGIGILLMVIGHAGNIPIAKLWIYSFHMPLFFIISGYVYTLTNHGRYTGTEGLIKLLIKNAYAYLMPYTILFLINLILKICTDYIKNCEVLEGWGGTRLIQSLRGYIVKGYLYSYDTELPNCAPLWFLTCLFISYIFFYLLLCLRKDTCRVMCAIAYLTVSKLIVCVEYSKGLDELPWHIDVAFVSSVFMLIGYYLFRFLKAYDLLSQKIQFTIIIFFMLIGTLVGCVNGKINMVKNVYNNLFLFLSSGILISFVFIALTKNHYKKIQNQTLVDEIFMFFGRNTIVFMGFNYFINTIVGFVFRYMRWENTIVYTIADVFAVMIGCSIISWLWNTLLKHLRIKV